MDHPRSRKQRSHLQQAPVDSLLYDESGLQILAYLEHTIICELPLTYFAQDVIHYYETHLQKVISPSDIASKLRHFWSHWHAVGEKPSEWQKIYGLGLKGLPGLEEERREWVRERAIRLKNDPEGTPRRRRSALALSRNLLSPAKGPMSSLVGSPSRSRVQKNRKHGVSPTQRKSRTRMSISVQNTRRTPNSPTSERPSSTSMLRESPQHHCDDPTKIKNELVSSNHSTPSEQSRYYQLISELDDLRDQKAQIRSELDVVRDRNAQLMLEFDDFRDQKAQIRSELDVIRDRNARLILELDDLRNQKVEDTRYWAKIYQKTQKRRYDLKRRNKHLQAEAIGQNEIVKTNLTLRRENDNLQEKLGSYKATSQFKMPFVEVFQARNAQKVIEHVDLILLKLQKVLQGQNALFCVGEIETIKKSGISALFKRGFSLEVRANDSGGSTIPTTEIAKMKLRSVVLGLVSTALCTWVFEAEVGALFQDNNLAYSKLQGLLAAQDKKLTNRFEFAAHEKCIDDPFIQDVVIPRRARYLARRILNCTMPLLEAHRGLNEDYVSIADEWLETDQQLTEIFKQALYAKVRLLLSTDMYKCILHLPGTLFDSNSMQNEVEGVFHSIDNDPCRVVDITIFPGLIRYASNKKSFNYNRFFVEKKVPNGIKEEVLRRAVVLTR